MKIIKNKVELSYGIDIKKLRIKLTNYHSLSLFIFLKYK